MLVLPQILNIFQTLPIPLCSNHLKSLNTLFTRFIWCSKKPRCSKTLLVKHRIAGGMGLVDIQDYFRASILTQLKHWFNPSTDILWSSLEQALCPTKNLRSLLLLDALHPVPIQQLPLTIQASLLARRDLCKLAPQTSTRVDSPIPLNILEHMIPNFTTTQWLNRGIKWLAYLYQGDSLKPFPILQKQFSLAPTDAYKYNQVSHLLRSNKIHRVFLTDKIWRFYTTSPIPPKGISLLNNFFQQKPTFIKSYPYQKWETDLGITITDVQWKRTQSEL